MHIRRGSILVGVAALVLLAVSCGGGGIRDVTLGELVADEGEFSGDQVRLRGTVVRFENPEHYVVEDERSNRVEVRPLEDIAPFDGMLVEVTGRFTFSEDRGRLLELEEVEAVDEAGSE
jgi:hypothetical protein